MICTYKEFTRPVKGLILTVGQMQRYEHVPFKFIEKYPIIDTFYNYSWVKGKLICEDGESNLMLCKQRGKIPFVEERLQYKVIIV